MTERTTLAASAAAVINLPLLAFRSLLGGILMGLANLVPGISGGTMLVASGIYPQFIGAIAELTHFRFRQRSLLVLGVVVAAAGASIVLLAGPVKDLVVGHRWIMYSLFIGLTLGGVPVIRRTARPATRSVWLGATAGFLAMATLAWAQQFSGSGVGEAQASWFMMLFAGVAGASAMILPGVSGGYLLLVLGVYVPILAAIADLKAAVGAGDAGAAGPIVLHVILPLGIGVAVGIAAMAHLLRWLLTRYEKATLGFLLGLLVGAVVGLWPFQEGVPPQPGETFRGQTVIEPKGVLVLEQTGRLIEPEDYPTAFFTPSAGQVFGSLGLIVAGFAVTGVIAWIGRDRPKARGSSADGARRNATEGAEP